MKRLAVMQGRLLPPLDGRLQSFPGEDWPREFALAEQLGLGAIELVVDETDSSANPVLTADGRRALRELAQAHGVQPRSVCGDLLMATPLPADPVQAARSIQELLAHCADLGCVRLVIPMVDQARLQRGRDIAVAVSVLEDALPDAERLGVEMHLETDLSPGEFQAMLEKLPDPLVRVNYDTGNSAALGHVAREEIACYGERIGSVHIKDRRLGGDSVPLGEGDADLDAAFEELSGIGYSGDFVLQVARGDDGGEAAWVGEQLKIVARLLEKHGLL